MNLRLLNKSMICLSLLCMNAWVTTQAADLAGGWKMRESPMRSMLFSADFADEKVGWAVGINAINQTVNGGQSWISRYQINRQQAYWFNSVAALDDQTALICGYPYANQNPQEPGIFIRTETQGNTWQNVACGSEGARYNSLIFRSNHRVGYVITDRDGLMKTTDTGRTWKRVDIGTQQPRTHLVQHRVIALPDERSVIVAGNGNLAVSRNDGNTWQSFPYPDNALHPHGYLVLWVCFPTAQEGWVRFYGGDCIHTRNGGRTWEVQEIGDATLWYGGGKSLWMTTPYTVTYSENLGKTWDKPLPIGGGQDAIQFMALTDKRAHLVGGAEGHGHPFIADRLLDGDVSDVTLPAGVLPIEINVPDDGIVTVQILDEQNNVVRNLLNGVTLPRGKTTLQWDLATEEDFWPPFEKNNPYLYESPATAKTRAIPGAYHWRALYHPPLRTAYRYSYYPMKSDDMPWITEDRHGGWLADHAPPQCLVTHGNRMWVGTFAEGGDAILESDLNMRKQWGVNRIDLTTPRAMASDGDFIYFVEAGGWDKGLRMIQLHHATKQSRKLFGQVRGDLEPNEIAGLAVQDNVAYITFRDGDQMLVVDLTSNLQGKDQAMHVIAKIPVKQPGNIRPYPISAGKLAMVVDHTVSLFDTATRTFKPIVTDLKNPWGLGIDPQGNFYVGEMAPLHQVRVYSAQGKPLRTIGKPGGHPVGPYHKQQMENPRSVAVDANGNVWVAEYNYELKRTSVWDKQGNCINEVLGPPVYGGGGSIDPENGNRMFYRGKEFHRDPATGKVRLVNIIWRMDDPTVDEFAGPRGHNFGGNAPSMPFHKNGKLWFRLWGAYGMGEISVLFVYDQNRVRPVSAVGQTPAWLKQRLSVDGPECKAFAWTDRNDDGKVQRDEVKFGSLSGNATWGVRMNENFQVAFSTMAGDVGFCFFEPLELNVSGYPVYDLPKVFHMVDEFTIHDPSQVQGMMTDAQGNALAISPYIISMSPQGKVNWRYICRWPGLHAGLATTAIGIEPGVLIAPLRFYGSAMTTPEVGEVLCMGTNYGVTHLMTADGMYIDRVFGDSRRSDAWRYNQPPTLEQMQRVSLGQEHFGGSFQKVHEDDGKGHYLYVVSPGSPHCSVVELTGLDQIQRIAGKSFTVTPEHVRMAEALKQQQVKQRLIPREYIFGKLDGFTADASDREWPKDNIDGFKLAYDATHLYVYYAGRDDKAVFSNAASRSNFAECFKFGDVVDVMLQTDPNAPVDRTQASKGDIRLSFAMLDDQPAAILYDYVIPGTSDSAALSFSSPWRSVRVDGARILEDAVVKVKRQGENFTLEAAIPLASIHLQPTKGQRLRGDVGRVISDQTGTTRIDRIYWSNPNTRVVSDVPSEVQIQPDLWGTFIFE